MSKNSVIIAMVLALALGTGVLLTTPKERGAAIGGAESAGAGESRSALGFDPARVNGLVIQAGSRVDQLERRASGEWWLSAGAQTGPGAPAWPVDPSAVRGLLRVLAGAAQAENATGSLSSDATRLTLAMDSGNRLDLLVDTRPLGGRVILAAGDDRGRAVGAKVWMTSELHDALTKAGPRAWRDAAAIPGLGPETARLRVLTDAVDLQLSRVQGAWAIVAPIQHPADPTAVAALLAALSKIRIADFMDDKPIDPEAFKHVAMQIAAESDVREVVGDAAATSTRARQLAIGSAAGLGTPRVHARLDTIVLARSENAPPPARESSVFLVNAEDLARLPMEPSAYVSKTNLAIPTGEIGRVVCSRTGGSDSLTFERTATGWERTSGGNAGVVMAGADAVQVASLLRWLCETPCDGATIQKAPHKLDAAIRISAHTLADSPAVTLTVGLVRSGEGAAATTSVITIDREVVREFRAPAAVELLAWLDDQVPRATKAPR